MDWNSKEKMTSRLCTTDIDTDTDMDTEYGNSKKIEIRHFKKNENTNTAGTRHIYKSIKKLNRNNKILRTIVYE